MEEKKTITILGIPYTIEETEVVDKYNPSDGMIIYSECTIRIDKTLPAEMKNRVLMHEIVHAIFNILGYSEDAGNEQKVQGIATALHLLLKSQNPICFS